MKTFWPHAPLSSIRLFILLFLYSGYPSIIFVLDIELTFVMNCHVPFANKFCQCDFDGEKALDNG